VLDFVLNAFQILTCSVSLILRDRYLYYPSFVNGETGPEMLRNLPKDTQLLRNGTEIVWLQSHVFNCSALKPGREPLYFHLPSIYFSPLTDGIPVSFGEASSGYLMQSQWAVTLSALHPGPRCRPGTRPSTRVKGTKCLRHLGCKNFF